MKNSKQKIMLGVFIAIGLAAFTFAIFYVGQNKNMFSSNIRLSSVFKSVNGLDVGNNVRFAGIKVGSVSDIIILDDTSVRVNVVVDQSYQKFLRKDSKMAIGSDGLMGDKLIDLTSGTITVENVKDGDFLVAVRPLDMDGIMKTAQSSLANIEIISKEIAEMAYKANHSNGIVHTLLDDEEASNRVKHILRNTEAATANLTQDLKAAQSNFLLKGYFKKKEKEKEEKVKEKEEKVKEVKEEKEKVKEEKEKEEKKK